MKPRRPCLIASLRGGNPLVIGRRARNIRTFFRVDSVVSCGLVHRSAFERGFSMGSRSKTTVAVLSLLAIAAPLNAQYRGSLQGTVTDPQGQTVPNATVT